MTRLETAAVAVALAVAASACGGTSADDDGSGLGAIETPTFAEDDTTTTTTIASHADETAPPGDDPVQTTTTTATTAPGSDPTTTSPANAEAEAEIVSFDDPVGDATPGVGTDRPPAWTDLAEATMERRSGTYRLAIRLGGDRAPARATDESTMNVVTFFDVDGDGSIDVEIWANLGAEGWGVAAFDGDGGRFGEDAAVATAVDGNALVLRFPAAVLGSPSRFRFAVASEYGDPATMGSSFARRDDAPDDERSITFPE